MSSSSEIILSTRELTKKFDGLTAVNDVSLDVERGSIKAIIGPNGSGKTTFFNLITGLFPPSSGRIYFEGNDITRYSSLKNFPEWMEIFKKGFMGDQSDQLPVIMVGGKLDLAFKRAVPTQEAFEQAKNYNLYGYVECSSKDGSNIEEIFYEIAKLMMQRVGLI